MYSQYTITALTDVPALVKAFADARGWTTGGTSASPEFLRPGGTRTFKMAVSVVGAAHNISLFNKDIPAHKTSTDMPRLNGYEGTPGVPTSILPTVMLPTKLHLLGNDLSGGKPLFIAIIIECGFNLYRHLYLGNMVKMGNYTGGEVISSNHSRFSNSSSVFTMNWAAYTSRRLLFGGNHSLAVDDFGGVYVDHADNPTTFRRFRFTNPGSQVQVDGLEVIGGNGDGMNDELVGRAKATFAGTSLLVPCNLYIGRATGRADGRLSAIGQPSGARLFNMQGVDPGSQVDIGGKLWRCFPELAKNEVENIPQGRNSDGSVNTARYAAHESSFMAGLAYAEE